ERKKIEELRDIIIDKQYNRIQKAKAQHELEQFTISVGIYDLNRTGESINLGFNKIEIINCEYSYEEGFKRIKNNKREEWTDNFM
ncbi:MAG: hypothetical protein ACRCZ9_04925, partial [Fusobacteriaceae bacterium]